jgi:hypothetical protein
MNIGACVLPADAAAGRPKGRVYSHFASNKNSLFQAWSDTENGIFHGSTSNITRINSADAVSGLPQISVYPDPAEKRNQIYVANSNYTKVTVIEDKWDGKYPSSEDVLMLPSLTFGYRGTNNIELEIRTEGGAILGLKARF